MNTASMLRHQAVGAAKTGQWEQAVTLNSQIIEENPKDTHALNRLGVAFIQLKNRKEALGAFNKVLEFDKTNAIAKRHLERIKENHFSAAPSFTKQSFIEEPGKTKAADLHRLAGRQVLNQLSVGQSCQLKLKKRYISVEVQDVYIGALPEDLSFRLSKLIESGNEYECSIRSCSGNQCCVYLRETVRSAVNTNTHSFPPSKSSINPINDIDDIFALDDDASAQTDEQETDEEDNTMGNTNRRRRTDDMGD